MKQLSTLLSTPELELENLKSSLKRELMNGLAEDEAIDLIQAFAYASMGKALYLSGQYKEGLNYMLRSISLNHIDPFLYLDFLMNEAMRADYESNFIEAVNITQDIAIILGKNTPSFIYDQLTYAYNQLFMQPSPFGSSLELNITTGDRHKHDILDFLHKSLNPSLYLEIGVDLGESLKKCRGKGIGVDPRKNLHLTDNLPKNVKILTISSDNFFAEYAHHLLREQKPELVYIDGMHIFEFVLRDFINVEKFSSPFSIIVIDDIYPCHPSQALRRRETGTWTGDVWKIFEVLRIYRPDLILTAFDSSPTGLLLITGLNPESTTLQDNYDDIVRKYQEDLEPPDTYLNRLNANNSTDELLLELVDNVLSAKNQT